MNNAPYGEHTNNPTTLPTLATVFSCARGTRSSGVGGKRKEKTAHSAAWNPKPGVMHAELPIPSDSNQPIIGSVRDLFVGQQQSNPPDHQTATLSYPVAQSNPSADSCRCACQSRRGTSTTYSFLCSGSESRSAAGVLSTSRRSVSRLVLIRANSTRSFIPRRIRSSSGLALRLRAMSSRFCAINSPMIRKTPIRCVAMNRQKGYRRSLR